MKKLAIVIITLLILMAATYTIGCGGDDTAPTSLPSPVQTSTPTSSPSPTHFSTPSSTPSPAPTLEPVLTSYTSADGRITFKLNNMERGGTWPEDMNNSRPPESGHDFLIVSVSIESIEEGHIAPSKGSFITGTNGKQYSEASWNWTGIKCGDPHDIRSCGELSEGATGKFLFELPVDVNATEMRLAYEFFGTWGEDWEHLSSQEQYMDISLK